MRRIITGIIAIAGLLPLASRAEIVRFDITERVPAFAGRSFGNVGTYERITARATFALNPADDRNAIITDLALAPRNADGKVEATADVVILRPTDPAHGNGTLLLDVPNRGRKLAPQLFDDSAQPGANNADKAEDAGIGFLHRQGFTMVWVGWQGDIPSKPGQLAMSAPVIKNISGPAREEFVFDTTASPARATLTWPAADAANLNVTVRAAWADARQTPPGLSAKLVDPNTVEITRPDGFDAGALYEITYTARDPVPLGMGYAAVRDVVSFLRHDETQANPLLDGLHPSISRAIGFGVSQSGRFLRDFLYLGFNEDLGGRMVFDGLMPHVAGTRRMATNVRFGQPGRNPRHMQDPAWQADLFPFTYATLSDPYSGKTDGVLRRCSLSVTCPKVMQTDSEHEWWASHASLLVTDLAGNHLDLPDNVRAYMIAGTPHFAEATDVMKKGLPAMSLPQNPMHAGGPMRALLTDLNAWISDGTRPPASRVPMRAHGTLVAAKGAVPTDIPGLPYAGIHTLAAFSDQSVLPPKEIGRYPVFVPKADDDGMAIAGIRQLALAVPRATYTAWNPRAIGFGPTALYPLQGAVVPFAPTEAARKEVHDPRLSIAERYADDGAYVAAVKREAARQVAERILLPEDAERAVEAAKQGKLAKLGPY
ncbi:alpha/beta hydrolase domain-containing protein [Bradyrhizobium sp. CCGUVB14]|uniref:alpha/beta hydrolase domain-containing protein n=1 Tax=Bradyrhizobium sp. CCGUVB14 TaxID=2949628 RepID=UPI0020B41477|nr:alpha/beta hydrolase domain-containing protein [Bradyrhizobium sp. CCGUVB14]MCP3445016.1 alpha/beta hydrolase domain-containing protein [Bradyrhizobium sp. CCGUVB14]